MCSGGRPKLITSLLALQIEAPFYQNLATLKAASMSKADHDSRSNQLNQNNSAYYSGRAGWAGIFYPIAPRSAQEKGEIMYSVA